MSVPTRRPADEGRRLRDAPSTVRAPADLVLRLDEHGIVVEARGGGDQLPWAASDLVGRSLAASLPPAAAREVLECLASLGARDGAYAVRFALPDSAPASHLEVRLSREADGSLAVVRHIGDERQALLEAVSQRAFLRQVLDLVPNMIFAKDREGRFTLANRAVASVYGVAPSELVGKTDADFNPVPVEVERFRRDDLEVMDSLRPKVIREEPVSSPEGPTRWFQTIKIPIVSPDGRADELLGVSTDITARKEAEDRLESRRAQLVRHQAALRALALARPTNLRTALDHILRTASETLGVERAGVWLFDASRTRLRTERVFDRGALVADDAPRSFLCEEHQAYVHALETQGLIAAGDAARDPRTRSFEGIYHAPLGIASMLDAAIRSHGTLIGVVCFEHRGAARVFTIEEQDFAASIADLVCLALEASKRLALEEQLRGAQKMEAIGLLAGGIAHDVNNLLTIIVGCRDMAARSLASEHPAARHLEGIQAACDRAADLVTKILTFSRGAVARPERLDCGVVLAEFAPLLRRLIGGDIEMSVNVADKPLAVVADRTQLEQILLNLATNARQAMPQGGRLDVHAAPAVVDGIPSVRLSVRDSGHGIDEATMARLWEPFFTTKSDGTGLGLSMVYGIVRRLGGVVRAESRVGHGSTFHVELPLAGEPPPHAEPLPSCATTRGSETVLLAEDESLIRELLAESLGELGYTVITAGNGADAVAAFERRRDDIDMVILDVVMPKMSGPDALRSMKTLRPDLKVLFISGHAPESARLADALDDAGRAFLPKPFLLDELASRVREILDASG